METRPWGTFEVLLDCPGYKVKRLIIKPGQQLSLQSHQMRHEHWTFVEGYGTVTLNSSRFAVKGPRYLQIPAGSLHRVKNTGSEDMIIIEVQVGTYLGEDDIERFSDDYGRA